MNAEEQMYLIYLLKKYTSEDPLENYWIGSTIKIIEKKAFVQSASLETRYHDYGKYTFEVIVKNETNS